MDDFTRMKKKSRPKLDMDLRSTEYPFTINIYHEHNLRNMINWININIGRKYTISIISGMVVMSFCNEDDLMLFCCKWT